MLKKLASLFIVPFLFAVCMVATNATTWTAGNGVKVCSPNPPTGSTSNCITDAGAPSIYITIAPAVSSGFGTGASIGINNGTLAFDVNVGTTPPASGTLTMPAAPNGWNCFATDVTTTSSTVFITKMTSSSTTSVTLVNYNTSGSTANWNTNDHLRVSCFPI